MELWKWFDIDNYFLRINLSYTHRMVIIFLLLKFTTWIIDYFVVNNSFNSI